MSGNIADKNLRTAPVQDTRCGEYRLSPASRRRGGPHWPIVKTCRATNSDNFETRYGRTSIFYIAVPHVNHYLLICHVKTRGGPHRVAFILCPTWYGVANFDTVSTKLCIIVRPAVKECVVFQPLPRLLSFFKHLLLLVQGKRVFMAVLPWLT